ncbi:MAG: hypothetical protein IKZ19_02985, partial [Clostridia bacterium]|nr:hypothetical protein [Clostridia bacterium]
INDRHIEIIIRQMMKKVRVDDPGDTDLLLGSYVDKYEIAVQNAKVQARIDAGETELKLAEYSQTLMGITRAALATDSFLSAASFQETNRILTDASIKGKIDPLIGTKENVIIGKLIPAGTGLERYRTSSEEQEDHIILPRNVGVNLSNPDFDLDEESEDEEQTEAEVFGENEEVDEE